MDGQDGTGFNNSGFDMAYRYAVQQGSLVHAFCQVFILFLADMRSRADPPGTENCKDSAILLPEMCVSSQPG